ncbi:MAG: FG-GAP repeat protein [Planctomycetes bacterium]|nr:FG-GAP repeat protein [Planctomycetota bacterium]
MRCIHIFVAILALLADAAHAGGLASPVKVNAGGQPIDVARSGHAAPWMGDFDGDGKNDLLVGEYYDGRCRVYLNRGTNENPVFEDFRWFKAGADLGRVPVG